MFFDSVIIQPATNASSCNGNQVIFLCSVCRDIRRGFIKCSAYLQIVYASHFPNLPNLFTGQDDIFSGELMFVPSDHSYQFYIVMFFIEYWNYICSTSYVLERFHSVTHQRLLKLPDYLIQYQ